MIKNNSTSFLEESIIFNTEVLNFTTPFFNISEVKDLVFQVIQKTGDISAVEITMQISLDNIGWFNMPNPKTGAGLSAVFLDVLAKSARFKVTVASPQAASCEVVLNGKR